MAELFYTVSPDLRRFARVECGDVVELDFEIPGKAQSLLDALFLGRVVEVQKPLQVAFVDIGLARLGLIPLREGKLPSLKQGDVVLVQVTRTENPLENKGVRLSRLITLSLGPLLYTPFTPGLSLSKKLKDREVFKNLLSLSPEEGVIIRHGASLDDPLQEMVLQLRKEWTAIQSRLQAKPPCLVFSSGDLLTRAIRSLSPLDQLFTDDRKIATRSQNKARFVNEMAFDERCEDAWDSLFSPEVSLPQGGNLYIEETHAIVVIDVNSQGALRDSLSFNKMAMGEIFRQIRLRDLGGKIVVDLIHPPKNWKILLQSLNIPSNLEIWGLSPMGLLEMTRRRKRPSLPQRLELQLN